jgi:16S rRNA G1207 methylase RsmC
VSGHYFEEPTAASAPETIEVVLPDVSFTMTTDRGVFSHGRLDAGTAVLLRTPHPVPPTGHLLDLGCGAGAIAITLALRAPTATVWAVDVNPRARERCAANAAALRLTNVRVEAPDTVPEDVRFAAVWSNPPIRIGKEALHDLLRTWLGRLDPDGRALLVVQRHLGADSLQAWLGEQGHAVTRVASKAGYRVLEVAPR